MTETSQAFDSVADEYLRARSEYPQDLYDGIFESAELQPGSRVLDIGCGSGQATLEFATRGCNVHGIDPAKNALELLAKRSCDFSTVTLEHCSFEDYNGASQFHLIACAQAFHWLDLSKAPDKIADLLDRGGCVALFWHLQDLVPDSPQAELYMMSSKYFRSFPVMNPPEYGREFIDAMAEVLENSGRFVELRTSEYPSVKSYDPEMFKSLFRSASNYAKLDAASKFSIDGELDDYVDKLIEAPSIHYRTCLIEARVGDA
ncbi:MAG: class I SAM-dependent methyltransferase [Pseudomonadales bacterium]|nr:class I SAM-dependent methyltransferase [Pseudomonadales bacterium]